jgi:hypothetical protein
MNGADYISGIALGVVETVVTDAFQRSPEGGRHFLPLPQWRANAERRQDKGLY